MALTEAQRLHLFDHYKTHLGEPVAEALMTTIPPFDWHEIATKSDLARLEAATKSDLARLEAATKSDLARLEAATNTRFDHLEAATNTRFDHLEERFDLKLEAVEHKLGAQIATVNLTVKDSIISQTKWTLGAMFTLSGLALTIAKLWL